MYWLYPPEYFISQSNVVLLFFNEFYTESYQMSSVLVCNMKLKYSFLAFLMSIPSRKFPTK
jgi:hypothetical protein